MQELQETRAQGLGREDALEEGMATHSSIFAWEIPWTEELGRLWCMGPRRVGHAEASVTYHNLPSDYITLCKILTRVYFHLPPPLSALLS